MAWLQPLISCLPPAQNGCRIFMTQANLASTFYLVGLQCTSMHAECTLSACPACLQYATNRSPFAATVAYQRIFAANVANFVSNITASSVCELCSEVPTSSLLRGHADHAVPAGLCGAIP